MTNEKIQTILISLVNSLVKELQEKNEICTCQIVSKEEENLSLQQSLQSAEQLVETVTSTQITLTSITKEIERTTATLNSERTSTPKKDPIPRRAT